ncbi:MAG: hypothetical protein Q4A82_01005 [Corynebacterium sp.]|nr:hypothetical protein [Corynebacterium sp.]
MNPNPREQVRTIITEVLTTHTKGCFADNYVLDGKMPAGEYKVMEILSCAPREYRSITLPYTDDKEED